MEDFLLKYGLLVIAIVLSLTMSFFAFNALKATAPTLEFQQEITGDSRTVMDKIVSLCKNCVSDPGKDQECFVLTAKITDNQLNPSNMTGNYPLQLNGNIVNPSAFRVNNKQGQCMVTGLG